MAGIDLGVMGGVRSNGGNGFSSMGTNATATQKAFGPGYSQPGSPSTAGALAPNDPFGVAFWGGVIALGFLLWIRHTLPH